MRRFSAGVLVVFAPVLTFWKLRLVWVKYQIWERTFVQRLLFKVKTQTTLKKHHSNIWFLHCGDWMVSSQVFSDWIFWVWSSEPYLVYWKQLWKFCQLSCYKFVFFKFCLYNSRNQWVCVHEQKCDHQTILYYMLWSFFLKNVKIKGISLLLLLKLEIVFILRKHD